MSMLGTQRLLSSITLLQLCIIFSGAQKYQESLIGIEKLEVKFSKGGDGGDLQIRVECTVSVDRERLKGFNVDLFFGNNKLESHERGDNPLIYSSKLTNWKNRVNEPITCAWKTSFETGNKTTSLINYGPHKKDVQFSYSSPVSLDDVIECSVKVLPLPQVTIWQKGNRLKTERSDRGSAKLTVGLGLDQTAFECEVQNALGKATKSLTVKTTYSSLTIVFRSPPTVDLGASYELACGLPSATTASTLASIRIQLFRDLPSDKKGLAKVSWRSSVPPLVNISGDRGVDSAVFVERERSLKVRLTATEQFPMRLRCRVQLRNGAVGFKNRSLSVKVPVKVLNVSLSNKWGHQKEEFTANSSIVVNCTVRLGGSEPTKGDEAVEAKLETRIGKKMKMHGFAANRSGIFRHGGFRLRSFSWVLDAVPDLYSVVCRCETSMLEKNLRVRYLSKPKFNASSPVNLYPGQSLLCSAEGFPIPQITFSTRWARTRFFAGVGLLTVPRDVQSQNYSLECVASNSEDRKRSMAVIIVTERRLVSNAGAGSLWRSYQWLWVAAVVFSMAFLGFAIACWWRSVKALEKERQAHIWRRGNSSNQLLELTPPSPCRTPDSGFETPETGRKRPTTAAASDEEGLVYAQLDFDERAAAAAANNRVQSKRPKKSKRKRKGSSESIVYDVIVGEIPSQQ